MATRLKLVRDPVTGVASWYKRSSGELFVQCAYTPTTENYAYCADDPDLPVISDECGTAVYPPPPVASSDPNGWPPIDSDDGGGGGGGVDSSSSSSTSSISSFSSFSSFSSVSSASFGSSVATSSITSQVSTISSASSCDCAAYTNGVGGYRDASTLSGTPTATLVGLEDEDSWYTIPPFTTDAVSGGGVVEFNVCGISQLEVTAIIDNDSGITKHNTKISVNGILVETLVFPTSGTSDGEVTPNENNVKSAMIYLTGCVNAIRIEADVEKIAGDDMKQRINVAVIESIVSSAPL